MLLFSLLLGCTVTVKGIVHATPLGVQVQGYNGGKVGLRLDGDAQALWDLEGCVVEVEGPKIGPWVWVRDWKVRDAGYGFGAWVGRLHVEGFQYLLDDRNTGHTVVLDVLPMWDMQQYDEQTVLAVGPVVGANTVQVMVWRVLDGR